MTDGRKFMLNFHWSLFTLTQKVLLSEWDTYVMWMLIKNKRDFMQRHLVEVQNAISLNVADIEKILLCCKSILWGHFRKVLQENK